jgi:hypothetical protein
MFRAQPSRRTRTRDALSRTSALTNGPDGLAANDYGLGGIDVHAPADSRPSATGLEVSRFTFGVRVDDDVAACGHDFADAHAVLDLVVVVAVVGSGALDALGDLALAPARPIFHPRIWFATT